MAPFELKWKASYSSVELDLPNDNKMTVHVKSISVQDSLALTKATRAEPMDLDVFNDVRMDALKNVLCGPMGEDVTEDNAIAFIEFINDKQRSLILAVAQGIDPKAIQSAIEAKVSQAIDDEVSGKKI